MSEIQSNENPQNPNEITNISQQQSEMANNGKANGEIDGEKLVDFR